MNSKIKSIHFWNGLRMTGLRERQKAGRRRDILAAASQLFARQGFADTSVEAIAALAEVGTGTVYNYFSSKGDLLMALVRFPDERSSRAMARTGIQRVILHKELFRPGEYAPILHAIEANPDYHLLTVSTDHLGEARVYAFLPGFGPKDVHRLHGLHGLIVAGSTRRQLAETQDVSVRIFNVEVHAAPRP